MTERERYCDVKATTLEEILETCERHIHNTSLIMYDLLDNEDGSDIDQFYLNMISGTWSDLRDDVKQMINDRINHVDKETKTGLD